MRRSDHRYLPPLCASIIALTCGVAHAAVSTYTDGHADFGLGYASGQLNFHFHVEGGTVDGIEQDDAEYAADDIVVTASSASRLTLPFDFAALGASAGDEVWVLPEVQNLQLPFLGLATEGLSPGAWSDLSFTLEGVTSPSGGGHFALWQSGSFGEILLRMSTADPGADVLLLPPGTHSHYNWGFSEAGTWQITINVSGTHVLDGFKTTTETLNFQIVPEPATALMGFIGMLMMFSRRRRGDG